MIDSPSSEILESFRDEYLGYLHDLKNPLSIIALEARLLGRRSVGRDLDDQRAIEAIAQNATFMKTMVSELLEMSYLEVDHVELHKEPIRLALLLQALLARTVPACDATRVRLEIHDSVTAWVDVTRIERVVVNFIQNALKYTAPRSPILLRLELRDSHAVVSVIDQGPGLIAQEAACVFHKYRRRPTAGRRDGLGLGLYISQRIIEAHHGRIGVRSTPEMGSTFFFEIPMANRERRENLSTTPLQPIVDHIRERLRGLHVLIVDNERNAVSALGELLGDEGLLVSTATSGAQALAKVEATQPDAIVLDLEMPEMDGFSLLRRLRDRLPNIPAVFMTGYPQQDTGVRRAREATGAAYVGKPVDVDELLRALAGLFRSPDPVALGA